MSSLSSNDISTIITGTDVDATKKLVNSADALGRELKKNGLTTSQIRALFGEVRQIEAQWSMGKENRQRALRRFILLKPKMAYRARKERVQAVQDLVAVLTPAVDEVLNSREEEQDRNFRHFVEFFEAILAYHKAAGGN